MTRKGRVFGPALGTSCWFPGVEYARSLAMRRSAAKNKEKLSYSEKFTRLGVRTARPRVASLLQNYPGGKGPWHPAVTGSDSHRPGCLACTDRIVGLWSGIHGALPCDAHGSWGLDKESNDQSDQHRVDPRRGVPRVLHAGRFHYARSRLLPIRAKPSTSSSNVFSTPACADSSITLGDMRSCSDRATAS